MARNPRIVTIQCCTGTAHSPQMPCLRLLVLPRLPFSSFSPGSLKLSGSPPALSMGRYLLVMPYGRLRDQNSWSLPYQSSMGSCQCSLLPNASPGNWYPTGKSGARNRQCVSKSGRRKEPKKATCGSSGWYFVYKRWRFRQHYHYIRDCIYPPVPISLPLGHAP